MEKEGYSIVFETRFGGYIEDSIIDYQKNWYGEGGFVIETGMCC